MTTNALVAAPVDTATPFSGAGLLDSGSQLVSAIESGDWVEGGMAAFSAAADTIATVSDPLGSLIAAGLGWLIDHFEPLKGWFNDLTGDAGEVQAFAQTWTNIQTQLQQSGDELTRILGDVDELTGEAMDAYRRFQQDSAQHLHGAATWAGAMATGLSVASTIVQVVHDIVRDVLSQLVGSAISWASEAVLTLGLATPWIVEQVSTRVASWVAKIGSKMTALVRSVKALSKLLDELRGLLRQADDLFASVLKGGKGGAGRGLGREGDADGVPPLHGLADGDDDGITELTRFFGPDQLKYYMGEDATFGRPGDAMFVMPDSDSRVIKDALDAAIHSGMAPSALRAWENGEDIFGVTVPRGAFPDLRLPTAADAKDWPHFLPGGHTAVRVGDEWIVNSTREFVVDGGKAMPPGTMVFRLLDGGVRDVIALFG
ncbi:WXG100 family type VII secretion target [Leifsonia aquatica]|uniref:WXG100 family type VII secretion target n=2 Tax=Leifsonia aquatica TaxID=144185 RepID=U2R450_LEIAQ|nr:hypothetical protein [Leifsonia aquatica]ERK70025.1 hypothetical protein N136_03640 [Leifsonia aquatica ATCC 14665]MBB2967080.1 hypothetical protein [Leifsonia aquatica]